MKFVPIALAAALVATAATAQTTSNQPTSNQPAGSGTMSAPAHGDGSSGTAAASGDHNQAVATTDANAPQPARGANSFSRGEARRRIESGGFQKVSSLHKDSGGIWRGKGTKDGQPVSVWLDYKGNIGQQ